jgi:hypothetical protein
MATFVNTLTIARPIEDVFGFLADLENLPTWNHALVTTRRTSEGPLGVGSTFRQNRSLPAPAEEYLHVTRFEAPSALGVAGDLGPFQAEIDYTLDTVAGGTRLTNRITLTAPRRALALALPALTPTIKASVGDNLRVLRSLLERPSRAA